MSANKFIFEHDIAQGFEKSAESALVGDISAKFLSAVKYMVLCPNSNITYLMCPALLISKKGCAIKLYYKIYL
jgi:hypothetical protein